MHDHYFYARTTIRETARRLEIGIQAIPPVITDYTMSWHCQCKSMLVATIMLGVCRYQCAKCGKWFYFNINTGG